MRRLLGRLSWMFWLAPLGFILVQLGASRPQWVEKGFSQAFFPLVNRPLSRLTGLFPFSLAEIVVVAILLAVPATTARALYLLLVRRSSLHWGRLALRVLAAACLAYFAFILLWGLNYCRLPFAELAGLPVEPSPLAELAELYAELVDQTNALRRLVEEDAAGVMRLANGKQDALRRAPCGYEAAAARYPYLGGDYGRPKGVMLSHPWSYTGTAGMYFPFTAEANVNLAMPDWPIPFTACHEMAHQRGFAREDEANFIAWLVCTAHPDPDFQYSGTLSAMIRVGSQLRQRDAARYQEITSGIDAAVRRDLAALQEFWSRYSGVVEQVSRQVNDAYLKANRQRDGIQSYGRMVDLLLAQRRLGKGPTGG